MYFLPLVKRFFSAATFSMWCNIMLMAYRASEKIARFYILRLVEIRLYSELFYISVVMHIFLKYLTKMISSCVVRKLGPHHGCLASVATTANAQPMLYVVNSAGNNWLHIHNTGLISGRGIERFKITTLLQCSKI